MKKVLVFTLSLCLSTLVTGEALEEVVVTGSRINDAYYEMPAVTIKRKADFFVQKIQLINDSRSHDLRKSEIIQTIDNLIKASKKIKNIELSYGEGFLTPVNLNDDSLQLIEDRKGSDTSHVNIFVKVAVDNADSSKEQISKLRSFIQNAKLVSRTEIETFGDIGLSIVGPEQYRYEILRKIAAENKKINTAAGGTCEITISGLEGRVKWDRSALDEFTLYIAYGTEVSCK